MAGAASSVANAPRAGRRLCVRPSRRPASRFAERGPAGVVRGFFRTLRPRRSAARRADPAADSVRGIGPAADPRAVRAAIAARAQGGLDPAARAPATAVHGRATAVPVPAARAGPARVVRAARAKAVRAPREARPEAIAATGPVPRARRVEARAEPAEAAGAASSSIPRPRAASALRRPRSPGRPAAVAAAGAGLSGSSRT